jgi:Abortive infection C-terminus
MIGESMDPSPYVLKAIVNSITGGSGSVNTTPPIGKYRTGPSIEQFFLDCNLDFRVGSSSRVPATTDFLRQLKDQGDLEGIKRIILKVCDPREYLDEPDKAENVRAHLNKALVPDNLQVVVFGGKAMLVETSQSGTILEPFIAKLSNLNFDTVQMEIARAMPNLNTDPEDSITAACSIIEAVCRSILIELKLSLPAKKDIDGLMKAVQEPLGLSPGRTDIPSEIGQDVRQILGGLTSVAKGIGSLRTHGGDAHGREKGFKRIDSRIARLSLHAASTISLFLIETWERNENRPLPQHVLSDAIGNAEFHQAPSTASAYPPYQSPPLQPASSSRRV